MKKLFALLAVLGACFVSQKAQAQEQAFSLGVKGGISIPNLKSSGTNPLSQGWESRLGPYFGIVGEIPFGQTLSIKAELNYSSQGGKKSGAQAIPLSSLNLELPPGTPLPPYLYANFSSKAILNYVELPVMLKLKFPVNESLNFFINGGPYAGYLLNAKNITSGSSQIFLDENLTQVVWPLSTSFDSTVNITSDINRLNFGLQAGVGLDFKVDSGHFILTAGGNLGLTDIQKDEKNGSNKTGAATITFGYLIDL